MRAADDANYLALVTIDKGIAYQQNLANLRISVILLDSKDTRISMLDRMVPDLLATLAGVQAGRMYVLRHE
ncbi:MAG: hypothetical protein ACOYON_04240 [Fimbriimonas sp.]